jgi:hypothetical protein
VKRPVSPTERLLVTRLADRLPESERRQILADLAASVVRPLNSSETILEFCIAGYQHPEPRGREAYRIEGRTLDQDGSEVFVYLFADGNDRLLELEILRVLPGPLVAPNWDALQLY